MPVEPRDDLIHGRAAVARAGGDSYDASDFARALDRELAALRAMLVAKNRAYGNSALEPLRVFSRATPVEQILVRIDDKLSRLAKGHALAGEDAETDLIGYLLLLRIARKAMSAEVEPVRSIAAHGYNFDRTPPEVRRS